MAWLGTMIGFMLWIWLAVTVVPIGAELDASGMEMETDGGFSR